MAVDGWAVTFGTARRSLGGRSVPTIVLLCGLIVALKGLRRPHNCKKTKIKLF